jgi:hypothetical protein
VGELGSGQMGEGFYNNSGGPFAGSKKEEAALICWLLDLRRLSAAAAQVL